MFPLHQIAHVGHHPSERIRLKLFGHEIIFEEFQPMWSRYLNVTNRQMDVQTTHNHTKALCVACYKIGILHANYWRQDWMSPRAKILQAQATDQWCIQCIMLMQDRYQKEQVSKSYSKMSSRGWAKCRLNNYCTVLPSFLLLSANHTITSDCNKTVKFINWILVTETTV